jgi:hypothetical protein
MKIFGDETLTLLFKMLHQAQETLVTPRVGEIKYKINSKRERSSGLLLITSLHKNE